MFKDKIQVEKLERVKQIVRAHNYSNYERAHQDCQELGINVNRPALDRFADRLFETDKGRKHTKLTPVAASVQLAASAPEVTESGIRITPKSAKDKRNKTSHKRDKKQATTPSSQPHSSTETQLAPPLSYTDVQKRTHEITFELGQLKIRENELLMELNGLKAQSNH